MAGGRVHPTCSPTSTRPSRSTRSPSYPATLEIDYPEHVDNWRPLVHWLLIIPYYFVASILVSVASIVAFVGVFVILFTKRLPEGMFDLILIPGRWSVRAQAYFYFLVTDTRRSYGKSDGYSPSTLITSRFGRRPSNSQ